MDTQELSEILNKAFNDTELRNLALDLSVDYEKLAGTTKSDKARELIKYFERRGQLGAFVDQIQRRRPNIKTPSSVDRRTNIPEGFGFVKILSSRGGSVNEVTRFLHDVEMVYNALYLFENIYLERFNFQSKHFRRGYQYYYEFGVNVGPYAFDKLNENLILPQNRLLINSIRIESPGFWEFLGALNPLLQIREYLNDRHRRRQDREYREVSERERLVLENELIQRQILEKDNSIIRDRINIMRDLGYSNEDIQRIIWANIGMPLVELGKHQDTALIGEAE